MKPNPKNNMTKLTPTEMMEALTRSGYLLESEVSSTLSRKGFFVETNQAMIDPNTGKSREIDMCAEHYDSSFEREGSNYKSIAKTRYIFEIKNNLYPVVLLTRWELTPNMEPEFGLKNIITVPEGMFNEYSGVYSYYDPLITDKMDNIYTQYCSFDYKKQGRAPGDLMAHHPEVMYEGISKITIRCEQILENWQKSEDEGEYRDEYLRHFLYMPVLLLNDDLYLLKAGKLKKVNNSVLVYNYHYKGEEKIAFVFVLTKKALIPFVNRMQFLDKEIEKKMVEIRKKKGFVPTAKKF